MALVLGACGGGGSKAHTAATKAPSAAASSGAAAANPSASASPTGPDGDKYLAGLLKPADFEAGLSSVSGYPNWDNGDTGDVHGLAALDCYTLENGGEASGSIMQAYDVMSSNGPNQDFATQKAYIFNTGDATKMMQYVELRIGNDCAAFDHTPTDGSAKIHTTMTEQPVSGLGDEAVALSVVDQPAGGAAVSFDALMVRYGDTVVYVSFSNTDANKVKAFDLTSREKSIAKNLNLG
jgi:hypothetical protein